MIQLTHYRGFSIVVAAMIFAVGWPGNQAMATEQGAAAATRPASIPIDPAPPAASSLPLTRLPPIKPGQSKAARWLQFLDQATIAETWQKPAACKDKPAPERTGFCRLQWRKQGSLSGLRGRYEDYSYGLTRRLVGDHLADHLEFDIDRSPELRLRYDF